MPFPIEQPWAQGREEVETEEKEQEEDSVRLEGRKDGWLDGEREGGLRGNGGGLILNLSQTLNQDLFSLSRCLCPSLALLFNTIHSYKLK